MAISQADFYLLHVDSYLVKIAADPHGKWDLGNSRDRYHLAQNLKRELRPTLTDEILRKPLVLEEADTVIEALVDRKLDVAR